MALDIQEISFLKYYIHIIHYSDKPKYVNDCGSKPAPDIKKGKGSGRIVVV